MLGMFWIALELSNPMLGLITRLSLLLKNFTASKFGGVAKSGNAGCVTCLEFLTFRRETNLVRN